MRRLARRLCDSDFFVASWLIPYCLIGIPMIWILRYSSPIWEGSVELALIPIVGVPWSMLIWKLAGR